MFPVTTKFKVYSFDTLALANASGIIFGWGTIIMIKGDLTRFKLGGGITLSFDTPAAPTATTFALLPWYNSDASQSTTPFTTFAQNATGTITAANLAKKYITSTSAAAVSMTLPTATLLGTALGATRGTEFHFTVDNSAGANIVTVVVGAGITAAGIGALSVPVGSVAQFRIIFTDATHAFLYRVIAVGAADVVALTDSSTGTSGGNTVAAVTNPDLSSWDGATVFPSAAQATAIGAAVTSLKNAIATLAAKENAVLTALKNAGIMV